MSKKTGQTSEMLPAQMRELRRLRKYKLCGSRWCERRHRYLTRLRFARTHPDASRIFLCRTAPEAAARYNSGVRALREYPTGDPRINDFHDLFKTGRHFEGPDESGARIIMIEPPCCWVKISDGMECLDWEEWFVDPVTGRPARTRYVRENDWTWQLEYMDDYVWRRLGRQGSPVHLNGDQFDCRTENLADRRDALVGIVPVNKPPPITREEEIALTYLNVCWRIGKGDNEAEMNDPWLPPLVDERAGEMVPRHPYEEGDRRWLIEVARRYLPELFEIPEWRRRAEVIRMLSRPWTIAWGSRRRAPRQPG